MSIFVGEDCPTCGCKRAYKTMQGARKSVGRNCRRCANSISAGGVGVTGKCIVCEDGEIAKYSSSLCAECHKERSSNYHKEVYRFRKYGICKEDFEAMYNGLCHLCGVGIDRNCHIDHCHDTGKVRGLLCGPCNKCLGLFKDNVLILLKAVRYLEESNEY